MQLHKAASSDELTQHRGGRYLAVGNGREIMQETQQTMHFGVFRAIVRHGGQDALGMVAHDGKLKQIG